MAAVVAMAARQNVVAALSSASFRMVGPIYGQEVGLTANQIGSFLAAYCAATSVCVLVRFHSPPPECVPGPKSKRERRDNFRY